jgi:hypothetical protein
MDAPALRERLTNSLLRDVQERDYPSVTMLDRVEEALATREQLAEYTEVLLEKIEGTPYPGIPLLDRVNGLLVRLEELERAEEQARDSDE